MFSTSLIWKFVESLHLPFFQFEGILTPMKVWSPLLLVGFVPLLLLQGCSRKWNPDTQFQTQLKERESHIEKVLQQRETRARQNLLEIERKAFVEVRPGMRETDLNDLMGFRYDVMASLPKENAKWESRRYFMGQFVASKYGYNSLEYQFSTKDRKLFTIIIADGNIRKVEY